MKNSDVQKASVAILASMSFVLSLTHPTFAAPGKTCTTTSLTLNGAINPDPVTSGEEVDVVSAVHENGSSSPGCSAGNPATEVYAGTLKVDAKGVKDEETDTYFTCSDNGTGSKTSVYDGTPPTPADTTFGTETWPATTVGIVADYSGTTGYAGSNVCVDLGIEEAPIEGCSCEGLAPNIYVFADQASAVGTTPGATFQGSFNIRVKNCLGYPVENVKTQGGAVKWVESNVNLSEGDGENVVKNDLVGKGKSQGADVYTWVTSFASEGDGQCKYIQITETGKVANKEQPGTVKFMSGPWSAAWDGMKSEYTGRVSFEVEEP